MNEKRLSTDSQLIEAILYIENIPLSISQISEKTGISATDVKLSLQEIQQCFINESHGIVLLESAETWQFVPSTDLTTKLRKCYGRKVDKRLSKAALETLAIIAYSQPVTRREIDGIRGVASDTMVRFLKEREYIKVIGRKDVPGRPCLYGTSAKFLYTFNLKSISELPELSPIDRKRFEKDED